ncbi:MAG: Mur ligase family protein [Actinomycetota bacterium]|nr:Mur ligase family protein [Actinomycetota bacterium]
MGFERIEELLRLLGNPENNLRPVQIVGTNGKGTTAVALSAALEEAGESTGTYLSPHLLSYTERVMIGVRQSSEEEFALGMGKALDVSDEHGVSASQFELLTAGAVGMFRDAGVRWAVMEAGLGARHDATTAVGPETIVLTNVSLDHTEYLGETVEEIAREKLAGIPRGGTLILGSDDPKLLDIAREECESKEARLVHLASSEEELSGSLLVGLPPYAAKDVLLGFRSAEVLLGRELGDGVLEKVVSRIRGVLPGRFEVREVEGIPVVIDGGHNVEGVRAAVEAVKEVYGARPIGVVFGVLRDKDIRSMLTGLREEARKLALTLPEGGRAAEPEWVSSEFDPRDSAGNEALVEPEIGAAIGRIVGEMKRLDGVVLITGSLFTGAAALRWMGGDGR